MRLADRVRDIGTESAFEAAGRARALEAQGRPIIHLEIGEPDFDTPPNVREAAKSALDQGFTHYGPPLGMPRLREAIAADATARKGFPVDPANVIVTPGAKPVMYYTMLALGEPGVEIMVPDPGFPIYESMATFSGATAVPIPLRQEHDFRIDIDELRSLVTDRTRLMVINSPHNPCGSILTAEDLAAIAAVAIERDLIVLSDEIYGRIQYDGEFHSIAALPGMAERTIVLDGFSKTYSMTGWRLGYAIVPPELVPVFSRLIINSVSCTSSFSQVAAVEALTGPQDAIDAMVAEFRARRSLLVDGLNALPGVTCRMPHGAFYAFPDVSGTGMNGPEFAERLLLEADVSVLSGTAFGRVGRDHIRVSYANSRQNIEAALERMARLLAGEAGRVSDQPRVLVTREIPEAGLRLLREAAFVDVWDGVLPPPRAELLRRVAGVDGLLALLTDRVDDELLDAAGAQLKVVSNFAVGYDNIDVAACARRGIPVGNTPDVLTEATADLAITLLLSVARRIPEANAFVRDDRWVTWGPLLLLGKDVSGATLGIVGFGRIGREVARRARGFGMRILYTSRNRAPEAVESELGATFVPFGDLLAESDFVSVHVSLSAETRHLIDAAALARMRPGAVLINTARGPVVDQAALTDALRSGHLWGAGLDVTDPEPMRADDPLVSLPNCLVVPHVASATERTRDRMAEKAARNLLAGLRGEPLPDPVSLPVTPG